MSLFKKIFHWKNYLVIYLFVILLFNLAFINLPLINVFGYEFSVLNSFLLTIISGLFIISHSIKKKGRGFSENLFLAAILFLSIPFLVSVINSFFSGFCSFSDGLFFYLVITLPSIIIGYATGLASFFLFKKFRRLIFFLIFILILLIALAEFYFNPQVYFYNPILGYLPGTIYDEALTVDLKLVIYRVLNLIFFGGLFTALTLHFSGKIRLLKSYVLSYLILIPLVFLFLSPSLGYSTTFTSLKSELSNVVSTDHFEIYFANDINEDLVKLIVLHHEYCYKELVEYLEIVPKEKISSFIFKDRFQKKKLFGSANADVAKTWLYSIFTTYDSYNSSLKHEIAHCFSTEFGAGPFKVADMLNPSLIEGLATASSPFYNENAIDCLASVAYNGGFKVSLEKMYKFSSFFTQSSTISYIYAGSFTKYLIENYGIEKFKRLYTNLNFPEIYGKPLSKLEKEYVAYLGGFDTDNTRDKANYYFGRKSIFYKVCPRFIADRLGKAWFLYRQKKYEDAIELFNLVLEKGENYSALSGLSESLAEMNKRDSAIVLLKTYLNKFESTGYYYNLEFRLADLYAESSDIKSADLLYRKLILQNPNTTLYYLSELRRVLGEREDLLTEYVSGEDSLKYSILKSLNKNKYYYSSFPAIVNLSQSVGEEYEVFVEQFDKKLIVNDFLSAYGVYQLSQYMLEKLDFTRARRMAALTLRYTADKNLNLLFNDNFKKINWFYTNSNLVLNNISNIKE